MNWKVGDIAILEGIWNNTKEKVRIAKVTADKIIVRSRKGFRTIDKTMWGLLLPT